MASSNEQLRIWLRKKFIAQKQKEKSSAFTKVWKKSLVAVCTPTPATSHTHTLVASALNGIPADERFLNIRSSRSDERTANHFATASRKFAQLLLPSTFVHRARAFAWRCRSDESHAHRRIEITCARPTVYILCASFFFLLPSVLALCRLRGIRELIRGYRPS